MTIADVESFLQELSVKLQPLGDRVVVLPDSEDEVSAGGILIPDAQEKEPKQLGTVVAVGIGGVGKDCIDPSTFLSPGSRVCFGKYSGDDLVLKKKDGSTVKVKILHADSILAGVPLNV